MTAWREASPYLGRLGTWAKGAVSGKMLEMVPEFTDELLGLSRGATELEFRHMAWRTLVVFVVAVIVVRVGARRFLSRAAGFDIIVAIVLGSVLSRGINGEAAFFPSLGASLLLVALHHVLATLALRWHWFSVLAKGRAITLVRDGEVDRRAMARAKITDDDLDESLRLNGNVEGTSDVAEARLERNGSVSVVKAEGQERSRRAGKPPGAAGRGERNEDSRIPND